MFAFIKLHEIFLLKWKYNRVKGLEQGCIVWPILNTICYRAIQKADKIVLSGNKNKSMEY